MNKLEIETTLKDLLHELLRGGNQEGSIINLEYNEDDNTCTVTMSVFRDENDEYVGFQGY